MTGRTMSMLVKTRLAAFLALLVSLLVMVELFELDDKLMYLWYELITPPAERQAGVWLPAYKVEVDGLELPGIDKNLSGITFDPDTRTLWVVTNSPKRLVELNLDLEPIRQITLLNFVDPEALVYLENGLIAVADERDHALVILEIDEHTDTIDRESLPRITLNGGGSANQGLEGLAYDRNSGLLFAAKEKDPLRLSVISGIRDRYQIDISTHREIDLRELFIEDVSGLHMDSESGNLLVLSDESQLLVETDMHGVKVSFMDLEAGFNGLQRDIPQPEGVTMDDTGRLYVVSEPNLLYRFVEQ